MNDFKAELTKNYIWWAALTLAAIAIPSAIIWWLLEKYMALILLSKADVYVLIRMTQLIQILEIAVFIGLGQVVHSVLFGNMDRSLARMGPLELEAHGERIKQAARGQSSGSG